MSGFVTWFGPHGFRRPEVKNIRCLLQGMLTKHDVRLSVLSRTLGEVISPKKTWERLRRTLGSVGLYDRLLAAHGKKHRSAIRKKRYCIIDLSDIQKQYAEKMEGLGRVRDGDRSTPEHAEIGNGYWWLNAVMADSVGLVPVYSEVYSIGHEGRERTSENTKLLAAVRTVDEVHPDAIYVFDRGGDRGKLLDSMCEGERQFIIRGQAQRSLRLHRDSTKRTNIEVIARRVRLTRRYRSSRGEVFDVGIRRVYYEKMSLWLVVSKRRKGGLSWYLTNVLGSRAQVMDTVLEGYGLRWRVEEYHRQVKQDYRLEDIRLRSYTAIKNMVALVMLATSFCARLPEHLVVKLLAAARQLPRKKISDIPAYPYYMIVGAVAAVLAVAVKRRTKPLRERKRNYFQLSLPLHAF
jgi:hypothetical protein